MASEKKQTQNTKKTNKKTEKKHKQKQPNSNQQQSNNKIKANLHHSSLTENSQGQYH